MSARELKCAEVRERLDERRANEDRKIKGEVKMRAKNKQGERESSAESKKVCVGERLWSCSESAAESEHREERQQKERRRVGNSYQLLNSRLQSTEP